MLKFKKILALSLIPQYLFIQFISFYPEIIEKIYSNYAYIYISYFLRNISNKIPFAIGDLIYMFLISFFIYWIIVNIKSPKKLIIEIVATISIIYFFFNISWGINYYKIPISKQIEIISYSNQDLNEFTLKLIEKTNNLHNKISADSIKVNLPYSFKENSKIAINNYEILERKITNQNSTNSFIKRPLTLINNFNKKKGKMNLKKSILSYPLTYMGFSGYLNPFTHEYNINKLIPSNSKPMVFSHEIAHEIGFSSEMEANFIAYIALINSNDIYYQYFGNSFALRQCLNELRRNDKDNYEYYLSLINKGILINYNEIYNFWNNYKNPIEPIIKYIYDKFLKANKVESGIKSYSQSLSLILNYNKIYND